MIQLLWSLNYDKLTFLISITDCIAEDQSILTALSHGSDLKLCFTVRDYVKAFDMVCDLFVSGAVRKVT